MKRCVATLIAGLLLATLATPGASAASRSFASQSQMMHDVRDLSPLPKTPRETYTGGDGSDLVAPAPAPTAMPVVSAANLKKKNAKSAKNGGTGVPKPQAYNTNTTGANLSVAKAPRSGWQKALDSTDLYYGMFLNGPSLGSDMNTTYSPWQRGTWPLYIYHTLDFQYHFDRSNLIGAEVSAHHDLVSGVTPSGFISPVDPKFDFNDPQLWYTRKNVLSNSYFGTDMQFSVFPAVTSYSINDMGEYFSAAFDTTWNIRGLDRRWTTYFTTRIRPTVYSELQPIEQFSQNREWMYFSAGYYVGYTLSPSWQVNLSGVFDCNIYADAAQLWNRGDGSDDRAQLELNYYLGHLARIGAYTQTIVTNLSLVNTIVGLDITVNLLSAK